MGGALSAGGRVYPPLLPLGKKKKREREREREREGIALAESSNPAWTGRCAFACGVRGPTNPKPQAW